MLTVVRPGQATLRAFPWTHMTFHDVNRSDWIMFLPPWCEFPAGETEQDVDFNKQSHFDRVSYGRLILLFKSRIAPDITTFPVVSQEADLAFVEELWRYTPENNDADVVRQDFGCTRLYRTHPEPTYYVIDAWRIISDAPIVPDPINPTIPFKGLKYRGAARHNPNPSAMADSRSGRRDGSALFIVNRWAFNSARASSGEMLLGSVLLIVWYAATECVVLHPVPSPIGAEICTQWVTVLVMPVQFWYACLIMNGHKNAESRKSMHVANCQGLYLGLYAQRHTWTSNRSTMMSTLHEWWPDLPETVLDPPDAMFEEGCIWGLVGIGDTFSKSCCQAPCVCECTHLEGVWCPTRKDICVDCKWQYKHVTQLLDTISLRFPVSARPCGGGLFTQHIPLSAIPIDSMSTAQIHMWNDTVSRRNPRDLSNK